MSADVRPRHDRGGHRARRDRHGARSPSRSPPSGSTRPRAWSPSASRSPTATPTPSPFATCRRSSSPPARGSRCRALGTVTYDMAYGGNFYALLPAASVGVAPYPEQAPRLIEVGAPHHGRHQRDRSPRPPARRADRRLPSRRPARAGRATARTPARPPASTRAGWTARRAAPARARGWPSCTPPEALPLGRPFVNESVIGTRFTGRVVEETEVAGRPAIVPEITGRAWITAHGRSTCSIPRTPSRPASRCDDGRRRRRDRRRLHGLRAVPARRAGDPPRPWRGGLGHDRAGGGQRARPATSARVPSSS